jgi:hypothetical protein
MSKQSSKYCPYCLADTLHVKPQCIGDGIGCLITILTGGLFLIAWIPIAFADVFLQPWICQQCGKKN